MQINQKSITIQFQTKHHIVTTKICVSQRSLSIIHHILYNQTKQPCIGGAARTHARTPDAAGGASLPPRAPRCVASVGSKARLRKFLLCLEYMFNDE